MLAASTAMCMAASVACTRNEPPLALGPSRDAGSWGTLVLASADAIPVAPPPKTGSAAARSELEKLEAAERRTDAAQAAVQRWSARPIVGPWVEAAMASAAEHNFTPPRASRAYGMVTIAMYDAVVSAWHWKYVYDRKPPPEADRSVSGPDPSYPSEHAAVAGAASAVLAALFPQSRFNEAGREAAASRITAGANYPSDVEAGLELGRSVAREVLARVAGDEGKRWDGNRPPGPVFWEPPPDSGGQSVEPVEPAAGEWHTWVVKPSEARSEFPPRIDSPEFLLSANQLIDATSRLTAGQKKSARFWAAGEGTARVAGMWNRIALDHLRNQRAMGAPAAARILALMNLAQADAGVAAWKTKYTYWSPRPYNAIRDIGLDRNWKPLLRTPFSPSYVSAHAASSGAASSVLAALLPRQQTRFKRLALEAAASRLLGGVSFSTDTSEGLRVGRLVGRRVLSHAAATGVIKKS